MCGIAGIRHVSGRPVEVEALRAMASQLVHRGPDAEGFWQEGAIGFAHRRLSIIDPEGSPQPMRKEHVTVCFNGEIFNYRDLRSELMDRGHSFVTNGDTETLCSLYLEGGNQSVSRLDGQFAYAIYDGHSRDLWLFRDRLGVVPLYYFFDGKTFVFASEIKAILSVLPEAPAVDSQSLAEYLAGRSVPAPNTLFSSIKKLFPGHRLRLTDAGEVEIDPYWEIPTREADASISPDQAVELVAQAMEQAVRSRMVADVPVGAYLSGGLDSSLVVGFMSKITGGQRIETFSAGFGDPRFDELPFARSVSEQFGTNHHEVIVSPSDFEQHWHQLTWHRDAPISEPSDIAIYQLASVAKKSVKVLLSGEGADELFAGYPKYKFAGLAGLADYLPNWIRGGAVSRVERALPERFAKARIMLRAMTEKDEADRFQAWFAPFISSERALMTKAAERGRHRELWGKARGDLIQRMLYVDCHTWLSDNLLERGDRMAMAASVESRPPFLDHHLVELAFRLPSAVKVREGCTKWVVKEAARKFLPHRIVDRKKVGFRVPLDSWFRKGLRDTVGDLLLSRDAFVGEAFERAAVVELLDRHFAGRSNEESRIWTMMCLEVWHRAFFREGVPQRVASKSS